MKRIGILSLGGSAMLSVLTGVTFATPLINGATIETRTFNDCPTSTLTTTNNYPATIEITDAMDPECVGFANVHSFSFSEDGGTTAAVFDNASSFRFGADFRIGGPGEGEGGLRISPWFGQFVDGRFMANTITGEIACFGGRLPFYNFTVNHGILYVKGTTIRLEVTYLPNGLSAVDPATIQYRVIYGGITHDSPVLPFDEGNPAEDPPYGLWGILNDARAGGYFQPRANTGVALTAIWSNIEYTILETQCVATVDLAIQPETINLRSHGAYVTAYLEPAAPYTAEDIDVSSLLLEGSLAPAAGVPTMVGDADEDGIADLTVKFDRADVVALLSAGNAVEVSLTGNIDGTCFEASDAIKVKE